ncbi:MAG: hypothetical protein U0354_17700 [Candidatus Sericytochromatia bacterium]
MIDPHKALMDSVFHKDVSICPEKTLALTVNATETPRVAMNLFEKLKNIMAQQGFK